MAYDFVAASTQYLSSASSPLTGNSKPFTMACRFYANNTASDEAHISLNQSNEYPWFVGNFGTQAGDPVGACNLATFAGFSTTGYSASTWTASCAVFTSATSRTGYIDGGNGGTNTTTEGTRGNATLVYIGATRLTGTITNKFDGRLAEAALWSVGLNASEIVALGKGFKPTRIRPQSLVFYAPLIRNIQDVMRGLALTNNNTATVADHPRVY